MYEYANQYRKDLLENGVPEWYAKTKPPAWLLTSRRKAEWHEQMIKKLGNYLDQLKSELAEKRRLTGAHEKDASKNKMFGEQHIDSLKKDYTERLPSKINVIELVLLYHDNRVKDLSRESR